jgi:hypothetical protein
VARRYARDNRGRFASSGSGATARGGRLKTAAGNKRATVKASAKGGVKGTIGKPAGLKPGTMKGKARVSQKPTAAKTGKSPLNPAKQQYKRARSKARAYGADLKGADAGSRRLANSSAAAVRRMESTRLTSKPSNAGSPRAKQKAKEISRVKRAQAQYTAGMKRESEGPFSKASRKVTVARRAMQIYAGKVDPKVKAKARLTKTSNPVTLQDRIRRSSKLKPPVAPKAKRASAVVSEAKAARVVARLDANRPGMRPASGSNRKTANAIRTHNAAVNFLLKPAARGRNKGLSLSVNASASKAITNARKRSRTKRK